METEYKVGGKLSPFKRDTLKEVFDAFREEDFGIGAFNNVKSSSLSTFCWRSSIRASILVLPFAE